MNAWSVSFGRLSMISVLASGQPLMDKIADGQSYIDHIITYSSLLY